MYLIQQSTVFHNAQKWIRGAWLDTLNTPMNDMQFYVCWFKRILAMTNEQERLRVIDALLHRTDPGEGGRYIALGDLQDFQRHVVNHHTYAQDPGMLRSPHLFHDLYGLMMHFHGNHGWHNEYPIALNWVHCARTLYGTPLEVRIDDLQPGARYMLQVTYPNMIAAGDTPMKIALYANGVLVHDTITPNADPSHDPVYRYPLPQAVPADGILTLTWQAYDTLYPVMVSELWLMRV